MALTPVGAALDRSTPGFDSLVNALQSTTERIHRNREFARQIQAREDFAKFQADLEFENRLREVNEILPRQLEVQTDAAIDQAERMTPIEVDRARQIGETETDILLDRAEQEFEQQGEFLGEAIQREVDKEVGVIEGTRGARFQDLREQSDIEIDTRRTLAGIQADKEIEVLDHQFSLQQQLREIQDPEERIDRIRERVRETYPKATEEHALLSPSFTEDGHIDPEHQVDVNVGGESFEMAWSDYQLFLHNEERRLQLIDQFETEIRNADNIVEGVTDDEDTFGVDEIRDALVELRRNKSLSIPEGNNQRAFTELLNQYTDKTIARLTTNEKESRRDFSSLFNTFRARGTFTNFVDDLRVGMLMSMDKQRAKDRINRNLITFGSLKKTLQEDEDLHSSLITMEEAYRNTQTGLPTLTDDLIPNWQFEPRKTANYEDAFLTREQAVNKIYNQLREGHISRPAPGENLDRWLKDITGGKVGLWE